MQTNTKSKDTLCYLNFEDRVRTVAVIVAAGSSSRMGGINKILADIDGIPVIARSMLAYNRCNSIDSIVVAARQDDIPEIQILCDKFKINKLSAIVPGGRTRSESVSNAVKAAGKGYKYVAIADGARPFTTVEEIEATLDEAMRYGAAVSAVKVTDTVKMQDANAFIGSTPDRSLLWAAHTPQIFSFEQYIQALEKFGGEYTDDCAMMECAGVKIKLVEGKYSNIKITTPIDLIFAEAILRESKND